jgi:hypothetical protein
MVNTEKLANDIKKILQNCSNAEKSGSEDGKMVKIGLSLCSLYTEIKNSFHTMVNVFLHSDIHT